MDNEQPRDIQSLRLPWLEICTNPRSVIAMRNLFFITMICVVLVMLSCSGDEVECPCAPPEPSIYELEARVIANCYILEEALEAYMEDNEGACPEDVCSDTNRVGLTLIDYLPDGQLMENPFTGERTEPVDTIATEPGQTGYLKSARSPVLFYINGFGESYTILELSNLPTIDELESKVIANCFIVLEAVMRFALINGGVYPDDVALDTTPEGHTVISLLPNGVALENPFTLCATEPTDGSACSPGDTGYVPIVIGGYNVGCEVTGVGKIAAVQIFRAHYEPDCTYI